MSSSDDSADWWAEHEDALDAEARNRDPRAPDPVGCVCGETAESHPWGCDGPGRCEHCDFEVSQGHDPRTCRWCAETAVAG